MKETQERYVCSYLVRDEMGGSVTHGINTCLASSHAEAYGLMKQRLSLIYRNRTIHLANVMTIESFVNETFETKEFESQ